MVIYLVKIRFFSLNLLKKGPSHGTNAESSAPNNNASKRSTSGGGNGENDGLIKSETIVKDRKRYYLDLKENQRGRFLRVFNFFQVV